MKAYLLTTAILFALIVLAHIARMVAEGPKVAADPFFLLLTLLAAGLSIWAFRLFFRRQPPPTQKNS